MIAHNPIGEKKAKCRRIHSSDLVSDPPCRPLAFLGGATQIAEQPLERVWLQRWAARALYGPDPKPKEDCSIPAHLPVPYILLLPCASHLNKKLTKLHSIQVTLIHPQTEQWGHWMCCSQTAKQRLLGGDLGIDPHLAPGQLHTAAPQLGRNLHGKVGIPDCRTSIHRLYGVWES